MYNCEVTSKIQYRKCTSTILAKLIVFHFSSDSNIYIYSTCHTLYSTVHYR